jgi:hypothetical protein
VLSVFANGSKGRGFKPGRGDGFLRAIRNQQHLPSDGKLSRRHVKDPLMYQRY